jgi:hypothetical protein
VGPDVTLEDAELMQLRNLGSLKQKIRQTNETVSLEPCKKMAVWLLG